MRKISKRNAVKFTNNATKQFCNIGFGGSHGRFKLNDVTVQIDCHNSTIYSVFLRFTSNIPDFANNQFSGKHNFHTSGNVDIAILQFNRYFEEIKNHINKVNK